MLGRGAAGTSRAGLAREPSAKDRWFDQIELLGKEVISRFRA
ncbi:MAG TPA: hypothetical protein VHT26_20985 [Trebonia sp.]|nr:hypothetical protein [Trebonia sp.]